MGGRHATETYVDEAVSNATQRTEILTYTSSGTFEKGDYPWARYVRVRVQGAGGGGGGAAEAPSGRSEGGGGGGGGYAESVLPVSALGSSEPVTVGAGGSGGSSSGGSGGTGGASSFGSHVAADGGGGASGSSSTTGNLQNTGGGGGSGTAGQLQIRGGQGFYGIIRDGQAGFQCLGGGSHLSGTRNADHSHSTDGRTGYQHGGGGSGARTNNAGRIGGTGSDGIVMVEVIGG